MHLLIGAVDALEGDEREQLHHVVLDDVAQHAGRVVELAAAFDREVLEVADAGVVPHGTNLEELQLMADGGMSPEDVLVATTRTAAELMGLENSLGTIEPGKRADLVVVAGDPFDFRDLAGRIERVYQDGRLVVGAASEPVAAAV